MQNFPGLRPEPPWGAYSAPQTPSCKVLAPRPAGAPLVSLASLAFEPRTVKHG